MARLHQPCVAVIRADHVGINVEYESDRSETLRVLLKFPTDGADKIDDEVAGLVSPSPPVRPIRPAYANWLQSRLATLNDLRREGRGEQMRSLVIDLTESVHAMGCAEVEAAARAIERLIDNPGALDAAIEILRRIVKRAVREGRRNAS